MESRSKVFPAPADSLDHRSNPASLKFEWENSEASRTDKCLAQRLGRLAARLVSGCRSLSQDLSEVCFVSGVITAIIGAFIAISGIFLRDQARVRIYMECCGCAMVILGVLIVFHSLRMRADRDLELAQLGNLFDLHFGDSSPVGAELPLSTLRQSRRPMTADPSESFDMRQANHDYERQLKRFRWDRASVRSIRFACEPGSIDQRPTTANGRSDSGTEDEGDAISNAGISATWTPYCNDLAEPGNPRSTATIEAALSIALTPATLVGFRPGASMMNFRSDAGHEPFCCLHHTVQHKMHARKLIQWLRVAHINQNH